MALALRVIGAQCFDPGFEKKALRRGGTRTRSEVPRAEAAGAAAGSSVCSGRAESESFEGDMSEGARLATEGDIARSVKSFEFFEMQDRKRRASRKTHL